MASILVVSSWYARTRSTVRGIFVYEQAQALATRHRVRVLAPGGHGWRAQLRGQQHSWQEERDGVAVIRASALIAVPHHNAVRLATIVSTERVFADLARAGTLPDLIHAHVVLPGGLAAVRAGRRYGIPVVLTEHSGPFAVHLRTRLDRALVRWTLRGATRVVAVSPALAATIRAFEPTLPVDVVGNLVRTDLFTPAPHPRVSGAPLRLACVAMLYEAKGIQYLIQALALLAQQGITAVELTIGGDGPARATLEAQVQQAGLAERVRFVGTLDRAGVRDVMRASDLFVLPSLGETFGIVLGEAMACGVPVIATRCGGPEWVVAADTGLLVPPADAGALADAIARFMRGEVQFNPARVRAIVVQRFGAHAFLDAIERVYARVLH